MSKTVSVVPSSPVVVPFDPNDLISLEEVAKRLHQTTSWVRSKIRPRSPNPMPVRNLGRHLIFSWTDVSEWVRNCPARIKHSAHPPRRKSALKKAA